jgi:hypothetical protein
LAVYQLGVIAAPGQQFLMRATFYNGPVIQDQNQVSLRVVCAIFVAVSMLASFIKVIISHNRNKDAYTFVVASFHLPS